MSSGVAVVETAQASALGGAGSGKPDGVLAKQVDTLYDAATLNHTPKGGWSESQLDLKAEIEALECKGVVSVCDQLQIAELKLDFVESVASKMPNSNASKFFSGLSQNLSSEVKTLSTELDQMFDTSNEKLTVTEVNALIDKLESEGITVRGGNNTSEELNRPALAKQASSLVKLRETLTAEPTRTMESTFRDASRHQTEKAGSLPEGSREKLDCLKKADYLHSAAEQLKHSETLLGNSDRINYEQLTHAELKAVDPESLKAEGKFFSGLASKREVQLNATLAAAGTPAADIPAAIAADPLLQYYDSRSGIAGKRGAELGESGLTTASGKVLSVGTAFNYAADVAKSDQVFYYSMSQDAAQRGDAESKAKFDTMASEASDRIGVISRAAQTLIGMMTGVVEKAMSSA